MNKLEMAGVIVVIALYIVYRIGSLRLTYRRQRGRLGANPQSTPKNTNSPFH
jgi:hypothetical protein